MRSASKASVVAGISRKSVGWMLAGCALWLVSALPASAQTFTTLFSFDSVDGSIPYGSLVQGLDGYLYGTTSAGGNSVYGTVFKLRTDGAVTTVHSFSDTDGKGPHSGLVLATDGNLYGTTYWGGASNSCQDGCGTVFKITLSGSFASLHSFEGTDGGYPYGSLIQASDGNLYGTTFSGGATNGGTVFRLSGNGTLTTLYSFCSQSNCADGSGPVAGLVQATDGNFYGSTEDGGTNNSCTGGCGTIFRITPSGSLTTLHSFDGTDGGYPYGSLIQASDGNLYGTTSWDELHYSGTIFAMTPGGKLAVLYNFNDTDGANPYAALTQGTDGRFYGAASEAGAEGEGTVFDFTRTGGASLLYSFCSQKYCADGQDPQAPLLQDTNGEFYGTTSLGGSDGLGTVFSLSVGLGPFVRTIPTTGKVGAHVIVLGTNLTGTTSVTFNGTPATLLKVTRTAIQTTVPSGATTGPVQVVTPMGTLTSNAPFQVVP